VSVPRLHRWNGGQSPNAYTLQCSFPSIPFTTKLQRRGLVFKLSLRSAGAVCNTQHNFVLWRESSLVPCNVRADSKPRPPSVNFIRLRCLFIEKVGSSGWHFSLIFWRLSFRMLAWTAAAVSDALRCSPQSLHANSGIVPEIRPPPLPSTSFPLYYSPITLLRDAIQSVWIIPLQIWGDIHLLITDKWHVPTTVAAQSKAWTVFARSNTGIVGSNPTQGMVVCVRLFCCVVLCVGSGLATGWFPDQGVLQTVYRLRNWKMDPRSGRDLEPQIDR
jgi:hypothetical protein